MTLDYLKLKFSTQPASSPRDMYYINNCHILHTTKKENKRQILVRPGTLSGKK